MPTLGRSTRWPTEPITEDNADAMGDKLDALAQVVGEASHSHIRSLQYESYENKQEIRRIEEAWGSWDWGELEALGIVTKEQADFAREVIGFMSADLTEWSRDSFESSQHEDDRGGSFYG
jgi:hypothetical protein